VVKTEGAPGATSQELEGAVHPSQEKAGASTAHDGAAHYPFESLSEWKVLVSKKIRFERFAKEENSFKMRKTYLIYSDPISSLSSSCAPFFPISEFRQCRHWNHSLLSSPQMKHDEVILLFSFTNISEMQCK
jgi:hypothetical protein